MFTQGFHYFQTCLHRNLLIFVFFTILLLNACTSAQQPDPTQAPTSAQPTEPTVIFEGDACTYLGPEELPSGEVVLNIKSADQAYAESAVMVLTLYENKTIVDLQAWTSTDKPDWAELVTGKVLKDSSSETFIIKLNRGPIFLACFVSPPEKKVGAVGPIQVKE